MTINLGVTANSLEWAYSVCALGTLVITSALAVQAWIDRGLQREKTIRSGTARNRVALRIARGQVEDIIYMALVQWAVLIMGVDAMLTPPSNRTGGITALAWVFGIGLITVDLLCFLKAVRAYMRRRVAVREIEEGLRSWDGGERRKDLLASVSTEALLEELRHRGMLPFPPEGGILT